MNRKLYSYLYHQYTYIYSKLVNVKFSIGIIDENSTYQHNNSNFSVALQYRSEDNNEWITGWNTTIISASQSEL